MKRILLLFCLVLVQILDSFGAEWIFVTPRLLNAEHRASRSNFQKQEVDGQTVLLFDRDNSLKSSALREVFEQSAMIQFIASLRSQARSAHLREYGSLATVDKSSTPLAVYVGEAMGRGGPAVASSFRIFISSENYRTDSLMLLAPINLRNDTLTIQDFIDQDYFIPVVAHELYHGLMGDIYGDKFIELKVRSTSRVGHQADRVTDEYLAFSEGMAEAMELATLEMFPDEVQYRPKNLPHWSEPKLKFLGDIMKRRLVSARRNHFSLVGDGRKKDGELDPPEDLFKTEGVIATLLYRLIFKSRVQDPFAKVTYTLVKHKPMTFLSFLKYFCEDNPGDRSFVLRQFLESTRYISVSSKAARIYKNYYLSKKGYKQKKISQVDYNRVVQDWTDFRSRLYSEVLDGSLLIDAAVCPEYGVADESLFYEIDLNTAKQYEISDFFNDSFTDLLSDEEIQIHVSKILKLRNRYQWIISMDSLPFSTLVEDRLAEAHIRYNNEKERQIQARLNTLKRNLSQLVDRGDLLVDLNLFLSHSYLNLSSE